MVLASEYMPNDGHILTIEDFDNLEVGEVFFAVFPDICEGDYVFKMTPELMMDFDMRPTPIVIDTYKDNVSLYKMRKFSRDDYDPEIVYDAKYWDGGKSNGKTMNIEDIPRKEGEKIRCWEVDDHSPLLKEEIISWLERRNT